MTCDDPVRDAIGAVCDSVKTMLLAKNLKYGNSAGNPIRVFSAANAEEQLLVRIDDKLSRVVRGGPEMVEDEDVVRDLIGYLILLLVQRERRGTPNA